jgi:hypothetical protein
MLAGTVSKYLSAGLLIAAATLAHMLRGQVTTASSVCPPSGSQAANKLSPCLVSLLLSVDVLRLARRTESAGSPLDGGERYWVHKCRGLLEASKQPPRATGHKQPREMQPHFSQDLDHQILGATRNIRKSRVEGEWNHLGECIARVFACNRPTDTTSLRSHKMLVRQGHSNDPQPANAFLETTAERIVDEMEFIPFTQRQIVIRPWYQHPKIHQGCL